MALDRRNAMKILRQYFDEDEYDEIDINEAERILEHRGYYIPGTVGSTIMEGKRRILHSNSATYIFEPDKSESA